MIERLKSTISEIRLIEVDLTERPEIAVQYRIMSTPAVVINGKLEFTGVPSEEALRDRIAKYI